MAFNGMFVPPEDDPRTEESPDGELATYRSYLTNYRLTLELKCRDLSPAQLATASAPPSDLTLLGLVRHLAYVEQIWFRRVLQGLTDEPLLFTDPTDPDHELHGFTGTAAEVEEAYAAWREQIRLADAWLDGQSDASMADEVVTHHGERSTVRDVLVHLIEEYARHCGHADLLRERIDGRTGV